MKHGLHNVPGKRKGQAALKKKSQTYWEGYMEAKGFRKATTEEQEIHRKFCTPNPSTRTFTSSTCARTITVSLSPDKKSKRGVRASSRKPVSKATKPSSTRSNRKGASG